MVPLNSEQAQHHWQRNLAVCTMGSFTTIIAMTLLLPYLPLYVEELGVSDPAQITLLSGFAYAATFLTAALTAPLWGRLGDRYGRKPMLVRASLGMAIAMSLIGLAQNVEQLIALRLLAGLLGGFASGSTILVAAQTPRNRSGWALGILSSGIMAGSIVGPLLGGTAPELIGVRATFLFAGGLIFLTFLATVFLLKEDRSAAPRRSAATKRAGSWAHVPHKPTVLALLGLSVVLMLATLSVEPIITVYVEQLAPTAPSVSTIAGIVFAASAAGTILSAPQLGKLADRIGHLRVLTICLTAAAVFLALQAAATNIWMFGGLRFLMGLALGGLTPTITAAVRSLLPETTVGLVLGYNVSAQYLGQVAGPILGGYLGGRAGIPAVFLATAAIAAIGAVTAAAIGRRIGTFTESP